MWRVITKMETINEIERKKGRSRRERKKQKERGR